jgi:hypothetical protein
MYTHTRPLRDVFQTIDEMNRLSVQYRNDVQPFAHLSLVDFYNHVKNIPFKPDPPLQEWVQRAGITLYGLSQYGDCDDKSIVIKSYCYLRGIPCRFKAVSCLPSRDLHHVYNEIRAAGKWYPIDATYPENKIFEERPFTRKEVFA